MKDEAEKILRVFVATPLGLNGRGGIDRLNDMIFDAIDAQPQLRIRVRRLVTRGQRGLFAAQFVFAFALVRLCIVALRGQVDLLHIHLSDKGSCYRKTVLGAISRLLRIPYVVHLHGAVFNEFWAEAPPHLARAICRLFDGSKHIIVLGRHWADVVCKRVPSAIDKMSVMPNATPQSLLAQIPSSDHRARISFIGELGDRKGTPQLIEALTRLVDRPNWSATIAGNGKVAESLAEVQRRRIADRVSIPGWLDSEGVNNLLCRTDILVLPSFAENLPMVILEAFAHGVPVVSTPVGAISEVVEPDRNGLLVPAGDVPALVNALDRLIANPEFRDLLGELARRDHAERYDIGRYVKGLAEVWRRCLD